MNESELQEAVKKLLAPNENWETGTKLVKRISNIDTYVACNFLGTYIQKEFEHAHEINYSRKIANVLNVLSSETCNDLNKGDPQNISRIKNKIRKPDFLITDGVSKFALIELKVNNKTQREAITELLSYAQAIKENLPYLDDSNIVFIIISNEYGSLLKGACETIIDSTNFSLICLKFHNANPIHFEIISPFDNRDDDFKLTYSNFSRTCFVLTPTEKFNQTYLYYRILSRTISRLSEIGEKFNSHGFIEIYEMKGGYFLLFISLPNPLISRKFNLDEEAYNNFTNLSSTESGSISREFNKKQIDIPYQHIDHTLHQNDPVAFLDEPEYFISSLVLLMNELLLKISSNFFEIENGSTLLYPKWNDVNSERLIYIATFGYLRNICDEMLFKKHSIYKYLKLDNPAIIKEILDNELMLNFDDI